MEFDRDQCCLVITLVGFEKARRRWSRNAASAREPQDDCAGDEIFFRGAITPAFRQHDGAVRDADGIRRGDVKAMLASAWAIAGQSRGCAEADEFSACRYEFGAASACAESHGDGRVDTAGLCWRLPEKRRKGLFVVRNLRLDQQPRATGNAQQFGNGTAAAAGDGKRRFAT